MQRQKGSPIKSKIVENEPGDYQEIRKLIKEDFLLGQKRNQGKITNSEYEEESRRIWDRIRQIKAFLRV